ncbi:33950_t:CDS:1, partial [Gigaspora margarita]
MSNNSNNSTTNTTSNASNTANSSKTSNTETTNANPLINSDASYNIANPPTNRCQSQLTTYKPNSFSRDN